MRRNPSATEQTARLVVDDAIGASGRGLRVSVAARAAYIATVDRALRRARLTVHAGDDTPHPSATYTIAPVQAKPPAAEITAAEAPPARKLAPGVWLARRNQWGQWGPVRVTRIGKSGSVQDLMGRPMLHVHHETPDGSGGWDPDMDVVDPDDLDNVNQSGVSALVWYDVVYPGEDPAALVEKASKQARERKARADARKAKEAAEEVEREATEGPKIVDVLMPLWEPKGGGYKSDTELPVAPLGRLLKAFIGKYAGVKVKLRKSTNPYRWGFNIRSPRGDKYDWTSAEVDRISKVFPSLRGTFRGRPVIDDKIQPYSENTSDSYAAPTDRIAPAYVERFKHAAAVALAKSGMQLSAAGQEATRGTAPAPRRKVSPMGTGAPPGGWTEADRVPSRWVLRRVKDSGKGWINVQITDPRGKNLRYGWNGERWARQQVPPAVSVDVWEAAFREVAPNADAAIAEARTSSMTRKAAAADAPARAHAAEDPDGLECRRADPAKLRDLADAMEKTIQQNLDPAIGGLNRTARRSRIASGMREHGVRLQSRQRALYALADAHERGTIPDALRCVRTRIVVDALLSRAERRAALREGKTAPWYRAWDQWHGKDDADRKRFARAGLTAATLPLAVVALAELGAETPEARRKREAVTKAREQADTVARLVGKVPGFFPTPETVADRMIEMATMDGRDLGYTLEPSAGSGRLVDAALRGGVRLIVAIERFYDLAEILRQRYAGNVHVEVEQGDFMAREGTEDFDTVLMNPPFEKGQAVDHVIHAAGFLADGGRIVAIVPASVDPHGDPSDLRGAPRRFAQWVQDGPVSIRATRDLPSGTFEQTGVASRIVVIDKLGD